MEWSKVGYGRSSSYSGFNFALNRNRDAKWHFPQENAA
jgi:hypothetical protein